MNWKNEDFVLSIIKIRQPRVLTYSPVYTDTEPTPDDKGAPMKLAQAGGFDSKLLTKIRSL